MGVWGFREGERGSGEGDGTGVKRVIVGRERKRGKERGVDWDSGGGAGKEEWVCGNRVSQRECF